jgi:hypothetical protein
MSLLISKILQVRASSMQRQRNDPTQSLAVSMIRGDRKMRVLVGQGCWITGKSNREQWTPQKEVQRPLCGLQESSVQHMY